MILRPFKKISEQEEEIDRLLHIISEYKYKEMEIQRKEEKGLHKCSFLCKGCQNLISDAYLGYACKLDCKCEDRDESGSKR